MPEPIGAGAPQALARSGSPASSAAIVPTGRSPTMRPPTSIRTVPQAAVRAPLRGTATGRSPGTLSSPIPTAVASR